MGNCLNKMAATHAHRTHSHNPADAEAAAAGPGRASNMLGTAIMPGKDGQFCIFWGTGFVEIY